MRVDERACAFFDAEILILKPMRALCVRKKPQKNINSAEKQTVNGFIIRTYELSILRNQNNKYKIRKVLVKIVDSDAPIIWK